MTFLPGIMIMNSPAPQGKVYMNHLMLAFTDFADNLVTRVQDMKDAGYNVLGGYTDYYTGGYVQRMLDLLNACQTVGMKVIPWSHGANSGAADMTMVQDTMNHPAIYKIKGKPVYAKYSGGSPQNMASTYDALTAAGITRDQYIMIFNGLYAVEITWRPELADAYYNTHTITTNPYIESGTAYWFYSGKVFLNGLNSAPQTIEAAEFMILHNDADGLNNFAVDQDVQTVINHNNFIARACKSAGKVSMGGVSAFYASVSFHDFGFKGAADIWQATIDTLPADRPDMMSDTTGDDYVECSNISPMLTPVVNGLAHMPLTTTGFFLGTNTRETLTDHIGVQKFLRPWVNAYLTDALTVTFSSEKIFCWYWLHPVDAPLIATIPAEVLALNSSVNGNKYTQAYWDSTVWAQGGYNLPGINYQLATYIGKIRMAVHLTAPAYLRISINGVDSTSPLMQAGARYWECDQLLGTPDFFIISSDGTTVRVSATGQQPITSSIYPGGGNPMITEPVYNSLSTAPVDEMAIMEMQTAMSMEPDNKVQFNTLPGQYQDGTIYLSYRYGSFYIFQAEQEDTRATLTNASESDIKNAMVRIMIEVNSSRNTFRNPENR